jgi:hypothetical protein
MSKAFIGTSGWTYDSWRGRFYLETLRKSDWLAWYARQFPTAEINGSFYRTPSLDAVRTWRDQTPKDFVCRGAAARRSFSLAARMPRSSSGRWSCSVPIDDPR